MATSSNSANQAALSTIETGGGGTGNVTGGGPASVSFGEQPSVPAAGQAGANEMQVQASPAPVESFASQNIGNSSIAPQEQQQAEQRSAAQPRPTQLRFDPSTFGTNYQSQPSQQPAQQQPTQQRGPVAPTLSDWANRDAWMQPALHPGTNLVTQGGAQGNAYEAPLSAPQTQMQVNGLSDEQPEQPARSQSRYPNAPASDASIRPERSDQRFDDRLSHYQETMAGREEIRQEGVIEKPVAMNAVSRANRRFKKSREFIQNKIKKIILKGRSYSGTSFYETIFSKPDLMPHCVSIGSENLFESLREPNSKLLDLVNRKRAEVGEEPLDAEYCRNNISVLVDAINGLDIEVTLEKTPVNIRNSIQVRTLRAHYGRGVGLHPTQTKAYNADYDGDPAVINLDQANLRNHSRAMTHLIDSEGNATIDPDFFPLDPISDDQVEGIEKELIYRDAIWLRREMRGVFDAYEDACNNGDWVGLMRAIDDAAPTGNDVEREQFISQILKDLYDFSTERRGLSLRTQFQPMVENSNYNPPDPNLDPFVYNLVDLVDEIVAGRPVPNFQDFTRFYNKYYGEVHGNKNVPFRLLADFAKAINRTDLINIGSDMFDIKPIRTNEAGMSQDAVESEGAEVTLNQLWQFTCAAGLSKQISGRMHMGSRQLAVSTQVRSMVSRECPLPKYDMSGPVDEQFRSWIHAFIDSYNKNMRMLAISQISFRQGMMPDRSNVKFYDIDEHTFKGLDKALVEVFGDKTVEHVFPGTILSYGRDKTGGKEQTEAGIVYSYRNMSIENFSMNNRLSWKSEDRTKDNPGGVPKKDKIAQRISSDEFTPMDILMLVADRRTKQSGDYNKAFLKATEACFGSRTMMRIADPHIDQQTADDYIEAMHLMSPDMFDYFGMDSPVSFANNKWGKKLINASSLSEFRSTLVSMTVEYRLNKMSKILSEMDSVEGDSMAEISHLETLNSAFELELESLGSSSLVWDTIAKEAMEGNRIFLALIRDGGVKNGNWSSRAGSFWRSENASKYHTLITFLKSSESYETKMAVLADVTRVRQNYADINVDEVMAQLAHHPDRLHAGSRFDLDSGIRSDIDTMKESANRINSYRDSSSRNEYVEMAKLMYGAEKNKAAFERRLRRFSDDPGYFIHVDTILAADALSSIYDKTYDDSEKIKQQTIVNGYFGAVSMQRSGGYYTHLQQTDNAVVNMIGFDQITVIDIVRALGNPDLTVYVYDEFGNIGELSRASLCGGNTIDDVFQYLNRNPRIACCCRRYIAGVSSDTNGSAFMSAIDDLEAGDTFTTRVFSLLNDRPRFLAIAALCTPANNNVSRNLTQELHSNLEAICNFIGDEASRDLTVMELYRDASFFLGLDVDTVERLMASGSFDIDPDLAEYFEAAGSLYSEVMREISECVDIVRKAEISSSNRSEINTHGRPDVNMHIDESSLVAYYDARQQLSGARTSTMIGVEGSETKKNLVLKAYLQGRRDRYRMSEDGQTVVLVTDNSELSDLSLEGDPNRQISSICKFLEVKREKGAETFNAKSKKFGDDGTNSMIKFIKMGTRSMFERFGKKPEDTWSIEDGQDLLDRIAQCGSKEEAIPILAQALIDADRRLGYTDGVQFVESDYWNRADLMIAENSDGMLVVRTLEQLAVACRNRISDKAIDSESREVIMDELEKIVSSLATDADPMTTTSVETVYRCVQNVSLHSSIGNRFRIDRALRPRSSSTERNYALMYKIFNEAYKENPNFKIPSRERIEAHSKQALGKLDAATAEAIKSQANPDYVNGSYDYMGAISDPSSLLLVPGPQSLILFDMPPSSQQSKHAIERCEQYGMTAAFRSIDQVPANYLDDAIWTGELYLLNFFDMRLNGSMSKPIMPAPAQFPFNPDNVVVNVEDTTYEFHEGDATYHITRELADRIRVNYRGDDQVFDVYRLFPNVLRTYPNSDFQMDFCTNEEIQKYVVNGTFDPQTLTINGFDQASVDIGVLPGNPNFDREAERFRIRLQEFQRSFSPENADEDGMLTDEVRYDSILGFVKIVIDGQAVALAPVWPFHLEESGSVPTTFKKDGKLEFDPESHTFNLTWRYSGTLDGQYIKAFEGIGASNKMITSSERVRSRSLDNGLAVDGFYSTKSVASRLFASNKRIHTLISLMMMPRVDKNYAYNFAELSGSFPGDPKFMRDGEEVSVKQALLDGTMGITDWIAARENISQFHVDPEVDSLVRFWVDRCIRFGTVNPTVLLATKTTEGLIWPVATEFECFMDTSLNFQNALMKMMHMMQPSLCPESIDSDSKGTLFKPVVGDTSEDYGVMQMLVPHYDSKGEPYKVPENVYLSFGFFGDEFSGFKKVNFNAFNRSIDSLNVSSSMTDFELTQIIAFGRAGMSSITPTANMMYATPDAIMEEAKTADVEAGE